MTGRLSDPADGRRRAPETTVGRPRVGGGALRRLRIRCWRRSVARPGPVDAHLRLILDEIDVLLRELAAVRAENERIRLALEHWRTWHRRCDMPDARWPVNRRPF